MKVTETPPIIGFLLILILILHTMHVIHSMVQMCMSKKKNIEEDRTPSDIETELLTNQIYIIPTYEPINLRTFN